MNPEFWKETWKSGQIQFHLDFPHYEMLAYFAGKTPRKVVVPLCGKSQDLLWLHYNGHEVIGIEISPLACEAFFVENKLPFTKEGDAFVGERITLWCGDFFEAPSSVWEGCETVYDRAAIVALPKDLRERYAKHLIENWAKPAGPGKTMLLISLDYEADKLIGPPFSVTESEIHDLYGETFQIKERDAQKERSLSGRPPKFAGIEVTERTFELTVK